MTIGLGAATWTKGQGMLRQAWMLLQPFGGAALGLDIGGDRVGAAGDQHFVGVAVGGRPRHARDEDGSVEHGLDLSMSAAPSGFQWVARSQKYVGFPVRRNKSRQYNRLDA